MNDSRSTPYDLTENILSLCSELDMGSSNVKVPQELMESASGPAADLWGDRFGSASRFRSMSTSQATGQAFVTNRVVWFFIQCHRNECTSPPQTNGCKAEELLETVTRLAASGDIDAATDFVFDRIDRMLCDGAFSECDEILKKVDVNNIPTSLMRSFLAITLPAKSKLSARRALYERIEEKMTKVRGFEATKKLIGRLA